MALRKDPNQLQMVCAELDAGTQSMLDHLIVLGEELRSVLRVSFSLVEVDTNLSPPITQTGFELCHELVPPSLALSLAELAVRPKSTGKQIIDVRREELRTRREPEKTSIPRHEQNIQV